MAVSREFFLGYSTFSISLDEFLITFPIRFNVLTMDCNDRFSTQLHSFEKLIQLSNSYRFKRLRTKKNNSIQTDNFFGMSVLFFIADIFRIHSQIINRKLNNDENSPIKFDCRCRKGFVVLTSLSIIIIYTQCCIVQLRQFYRLTQLNY